METDDDDCYIVDTVYNAMDYDDDDDVQMVGVLVPPATKPKTTTAEESSDSVSLHVKVNKTRAMTNDSPVKSSKTDITNKEKPMTALANELADWINDNISLELRANKQKLTQKFDDVIPMFVQSFEDKSKPNTNPDNLEGVPGTSGQASTSKNKIPISLPFDDFYPHTVVPKRSTRSTKATEVATVSKTSSLEASSTSQASTSNDFFSMSLPVVPKRSTRCTKVPTTSNFEARSSSQASTSSDSFSISLPVPKRSTRCTKVTEVATTSKTYTFEGVPSTSVTVTNNNSFPICFPVEDIYPSNPVIAKPSSSHDDLDGMPGSSGMSSGTVPMQDDDKKSKKRKEKSTPKPAKKVKPKSNNAGKPATPRARLKVHKVAKPPTVFPLSKGYSDQTVKPFSRATRSRKVTVTPIPATVTSATHLSVVPTNPYGTNVINPTQSGNPAVTSTITSANQNPVNSWNNGNPVPPTDQNPVNSWSNRNPAASTTQNPVNSWSNGNTAASTYQNPANSWSNGNTAASTYQNPVNSWPTGITTAVPPGNGMVTFIPATATNPNFANSQIIGNAVKPTYQYPTNIWPTTVNSVTFNGTPSTNPANPYNLLINGKPITSASQLPSNVNFMWNSGTGQTSISMGPGNLTFQYSQAQLQHIQNISKAQAARVPPRATPNFNHGNSEQFPDGKKPMVRTKLISVPEFIKYTEGIEPETIKLFLPETWSCHQDFDLPNCNVVQLPKTHPEYIEVVETVAKTLPRRIKTIHRIENPYLLTMFLLKKGELIKRYGHCSEQLLFHGTNSANVYNIAVNNFDWRRYGKNVGHVFGCGVYFGSSAAVSNQYARNSMFLARVLIYWTENGANDTSIPAIGNDTTTSQCGNITVKYDDFSYLPKYMVTFQ